MNITPQARDAMRRAVKARVEQWDAEREVEKLLGCELSCDEAIPGWAATCDYPEEALTFDDEDVDTLIREAAGVKPPAD